MIRAAIRHSIALVLLLATASPSTAAPRYVFRLIADSSGAFQLLGPWLSMNNRGVVAFKADVATQDTQVLSSDGIHVTTIAELTSPSSNFGGTSISDAGVVAFKGVLSDSSNGVFAGNGGATTTIATGSFLSFPSINNRGLTALGTGNTIAVGNGGPLLPIASLDDVISGLGDPAISERGTVVFVAGLRGGGQAIFTGRGGELTRIADASGPFAGFAVFPVINDRGTIAFMARLDTSVQGIFTAFNGNISTVADSDGLIERFSGFVSINNRGSVAFQAVLDTGVDGIFTGANPLTSKVIAVGDPLFGSAVTDLVFFREGLNDAGQVAFFARLIDGREVIVRADPPRVAIDALIREVQAVTGLNGGQTHSLIAKLEAARRSLLRQQTHPANGQLGAFINEVQALQRSRRIDSASASSLITSAHAILDVL